MVLLSMQTMIAPLAEMFCPSHLKSISFNHNNWVLLWSLKFHTVFFSFSKVTKHKKREKKQQKKPFFSKKIQKPKKEKKS